ncbi:hypothetical protein Tco_0585533, partial [Tanacetum coccineum]
KDRLEKLRSSSLRHSLNDKVPYGQQNHNDDDQERNPSRVPEDKRSARTHMTGIPHFIVEHELKTYPHIEPRVQRKRSIASDRRKVVKEEVAEWLKAGIVKRIDWKIESLIGFKYKCFLDAYKGYHQIQMAKKDEEKTAFHTDEGVFCYTKIPFGLKNARATYQRLVDTIFEG